jgi:hypothetical protein
MEALFSLWWGYEFLITMAGIQVTEALEWQLLIADRHFWGNMYARGNFCVKVSQDEKIINYRLKQRGIFQNFLHFAAPWRR